MAYPSPPVGDEGKSLREVRDGPCSVLDVHDHHLCGMALWGWRRVLSWIRPVPVEEVLGQHGVLTVRWEQGRKVLNSAYANQSFGSLHRMWRVVLQGLDLGTVRSGNILLLGLGGGSVIHIIRNELGMTSPITAVEVDPIMVELANRHFGLVDQHNVVVLLGDATIQVHALVARFDLIVVDLFDDLDLARGVDGRTFVHGLRDRCAEGGVVYFNTVAYDRSSDVRCQRVHDHLVNVFNAVEELRVEEINRVFIAR